MTALTAVTAQNTVAVEDVHAIPPEMIVAQVRAVVSDIGVDAVKIGMVGGRHEIEAVAAALDLLPDATPVVLDPVMVAESGAPLLDPEAREALVGLLVPRATVVTPNLPEARALVEAPGHLAVGNPPAEAGADRADPGAGHEAELVRVLARRILDLGPSAVVLTGGHRRAATDVFCDRSRSVEISGRRHPDGAAHGSGCTHSSALAARLAWGDELLTAARAAKALASLAVARGLRELGAGAGPVDALGIADGPIVSLADVDAGPAPTPL